MCGFTGFLGFGNASGEQAQNTVVKMRDSLVHRGPDDAGMWLDETAQIALAHRRLSIQDISTAGHQPMLSPANRYAIAFNGEIYNHLDLRKQIEKDTDSFSGWRGHSDTETLLASIETWGITKTLQAAVGMFAFALWDRKERTLTLARDRMGEKPLYYGWQNGVFLFGSELKALRAHPAFTNDINRDALALLLRHNYIPAPYSIYQSIYKLTQGCTLTITLNNQMLPTPQAYWSFADVVQAGVNNQFTGDANEAIQKLEAVLTDAVHGQMLSDVPLGAFLSGGIDSSTIVALMQAQSSRPVKTFSIGFHEQGYNEAEHAKAVANHLGTDHTELYITSEQAQAVIPKLPSLYDEPFSDSSQIPTFLVSELAKRHVTVSLSGDGGDELFGGYNRYVMTRALWGKLRFIPSKVRRCFANILTSIPPKQWNQLGTIMLASRYGNIGDKLHKGADALCCLTLDELYAYLVSHWHTPASIVKQGNELPTLLTTAPSAIEKLNGTPKMMALDAITYLPNDILVKVDRAAMGVSLETRVPMLDHRVVEFAWQLPQSLKLRDQQSKWILRQVLYKYVPQQLIERPKMGFGVPIDSWLRGPLRDWAEELLDESRLQREGFFHPAPIRQKWSEHLSGKKNWQYHLWDVLMFQAWRTEHHNS